MIPVGLEKSIFLSAADLASDQEREAYLSRACGENAALRHSVNDLLAAHEGTGGLLDDDAEPSDRLWRQLQDAVSVLGPARIPGISSAGSEGPCIGDWIGSYRIAEKIGEGSFGEVYVAEQSSPMRRLVALKLLKPGAWSRDVMARFEAERQALARMDHPNIATVFDAGATDAGTPYFAMELVRGLPLTTFCEERRIPLRRRLELFVDVCHAVQHAHQKGIIHRDLKPSNVLVTLRDETPVVKVIDFGVAKAVGEPLTDAALTGAAQMIGTPMYMSPEQAEISTDIDTRSDIYSLGVILYELLTGTTPFDQVRLESVSFDDLRRIVRLEEPPRPSSRLTALSGKPPRIARGDDGGRSLASALRGDLDWIVMKAVDKDRRRRYQTASDLARDVERYLGHQPVAARPPSTLYRFCRFAQRNKVMFTSASVVVLALLAGTAISTWQAVLARSAQADAEALRQEVSRSADRLREASVLLDSARANADEKRWSQAWAEYTRATELQPAHYVTWSARGSLLARLGAWKSAASDFSRALRLGAAANHPLWWGVPQLCLHAGDEDAYRIACAALEERLEMSADPVFVLFAIRSLCIREVPLEKARSLALRAERLLAESGSVSGGPGPADAESPRRGPPSQGAGRRGDPFRRRPPVELEYYAAGLAHFRAGELEEALRHLRRVTEAPTEFPASRLALPVLAMACRAAGQQAEAEEALAAARRTVQDWTSILEDGSLDRLPLPWFDYLELLVLHGEALERTGEAFSPADGTLEGLEARALALLRGE